MTNQTHQSLDRLSITLHWLVTVVVICLMTIGIYMTENKAFDLYPIHKSIGILALFIILIRVFWRIIQGWPKPVSQYKKIEQRLSKIIHWLLLLATMAMPISGIIMNIASGRGLAVFAWTLLATNPDPLKPGKMLALNETLAGIAHTMHHFWAKVLFVCIVLHVLGALKHHILDKDNTLKRMLGRG